MAWIEVRKQKSGAMTYWVRDIRNGQQVVIPAGGTRTEAEKAMDKYLVRFDLEKEGYEDGLD